MQNNEQISQSIQKSQFQRTQLLCSVLIEFSKELMTTWNLRETSLSIVESQNIKDKLQQLLGSGYAIWDLLEFSSRVCVQSPFLRRAHSVLTVVAVKANPFPAFERLKFEDLIEYFSGMKKCEGNLFLLIRILRNLYYNKIELHPDLQKLLEIDNQDMNQLFESYPHPLLSFEEQDEIVLSKKLVQREIIKQGSNAFTDLVSVVNDQLSEEKKSENSIQMETEKTIDEILNRSKDQEKDFNYYLKVIQFILQTENFCLISGPKFSGKSHLIHNFLSNQSDYIKVVIDQSVEAKTLVGDYVVSHSKSEENENGEHQGLKMFEWEDGPLVECIHSGKVLVLEQVEAGSEELKGFLKGFIRSKQVQVRGQILTVGNGFGLLMVWRTKDGLKTKSRPKDLEIIQENQEKKEKIDLVEEEMLVRLPEMTTERFLSIVLKDKNFLNKNFIMRDIFKMLVDFKLDEDPRKLHYLSKRFEHIFNKFLQKSSNQTFLSDRIKEFLLVDINDVLFKSNSSSFLEFLEANPKILATLGLSQENIQVLLNTYSASLKFTSNFVSSSKFFVSKEESRVLPTSDQFGEFINSFQTGSGFVSNSSLQVNLDFCATNKYQVYLGKSIQIVLRS